MTASPDTARAPGPVVGRLNTLLGMIKFSHTLFALPFAVLGALLASAHGGSWVFRPLDWLGILLCMVTARSAAMAFNRLVDRDLDARNPRTAARHLPAGILTPSQVARFTAASAFLFVAATLLFLPRNPWPLILAVPVLGWLLAYSYAKRFTSLVHFWLGASLAFAPVAAWIAIRGDIAWPPVLLGLAVLTWVAGFDIIYACQDVEFDRSSGLESLPARLGVRRALLLAAGCHGFTILFLAAVGWVYPLGPIYASGVLLAALLLVVEHRLVRADNLRHVNVAFFYVNIVLSAGMLVFTAVDLIV
jgi:4-hydroxybenzoate polyprenyltransferase